MIRCLDIALATALLLLASCRSYDREPPSNKDWAIGDAEAIEGAVWMWNSHVQPTRHIACDVPDCSVGDDEWRLVKEELGLALDGEETGGETFYTQRVIAFDLGLNDGLTYDIAAHEFGHALGLKHTTTGFMSKDLVSDDFTPEVFAECRRVGACL